MLSCSLSLPLSVAQFKVNPTLQPLSLSLSLSPLFIVIAVCSLLYASDIVILLSYSSLVIIIDNGKICPVGSQLNVDEKRSLHVKMGVDRDLEFEKYCKVDQSPRTVLPSSQHCTKRENRSRKSRSTSRNNQLSLEAGFKEIKLRNYHRSVSCKSIPSRNTELAVDREVLKRGSIYHSSKERTSFKRTDSVGGRNKIEFSLSGDTPFSFGVLDSICGSDEEEEPSLEVVSPREASSVKLDNREDSSSRLAERGFMENYKFKSHGVVGPSSSDNILEEEDNQALQKSLSAKLALPHSPTHSNSDGCNGSPMSRFTPSRKMFDPLTKSKSDGSHLSSKFNNGVIRSSDPTIRGRNKTVRKSLLHDFSNAAPHKETNSQCVKKDQEQIVSPCSPAHLHGDLRVGHKHGVPYFELSLAHSENVLVAKTWKAEDALNWVYTFHSVPCRKNSNNASRWGIKYSNKVSPMVGQMQVSCHLCSELKDGGAFSNSMMTEFVLYDIMHARKSCVAEESGQVPDVVEAHASSGDAFGSDSSIKLKTQAANTFELRSMDFSSAYPWAAADLHPCHEIAAIVIQVPFEKRESLKHRSGDKLSRQVHSNLLDLSLAEQTPKGGTDCSSTRISVVTPLGNHSLPTRESRGASPLLDRWRLGGGCDCGGWDMACPLVVFNNLSTQCKEEHSVLQSDQSFDLYAQGAKEKTPALTIRFTRKGHYSVEFHAQLSALQALAICVAMLHTTEASTAADQEKHKQLLQCSSLKALVEDELKILIEAVTEENDKKKVKEKVIKATEGHQPSFVLDPPFSPISRV